MSQREKRHLRLTVSISLWAGFNAALAANVEIITPVNGGFAVKNSSNTLVRLLIEDNGQFTIPWLTSAPAQGLPVCFQAATGLLGSCSGAGLVGPAGPVGAAGPIGLAGATGATGPQGPQGQAGATGATGPTGATGTSSSAAGSTGHVQFNSSNAFAADPNFYWDNVNKRLGIGTTAPEAKTQIIGGQLTGLSTFGFPEISYPMPVLMVGGNISGQNNFLGTFAGVQTVMHIKGGNWFRGQGTGIALSMGISEGYSSRIVHYSDVGNSVGSRMQLQTHTGAAGVWSPGIKIYEDGTITLGNDADPVFAPSTSLLSLWATTAQSMTGPLAIVGTDGTSPLLNVLNGGNVGIGTVIPTQSLEVNGGIRQNTATAKPACSVATRGTTWFTQGGASVSDAFEVCAKDASDAYAWRSTY